MTGRSATTFVIRRFHRNILLGNFSPKWNMRKRARSEKRDENAKEYRWVDFIVNRNTVPDLGPVTIDSHEEQKNDFHRRWKSNISYRLDFEDEEGIDEPEFLF